MDAAIAAREEECEELEDELASAEDRLERSEAAIEARDRELARAGQRVDELDRVAMHLAARVVQRDRELRRLRAKLEKGGPEAIVPADEPERPASVPAGSNGHAPGGSGELFDGLIEVEIGPLSDFSQLVGFEDAADGIAATSEISVKRFTKGRATLAMKLSEPVALLRELEERAPFEFRVRDLRSDRLVLDVDEE